MVCQVGSEKASPQAASVSSVPNDDEEANLETAPLVLGKKEGGVRPTTSALASTVMGHFGIQNYMSNLEHHFGRKLLVLLFVSQHMLKGFTAAFTGPATSYLYASYKVVGPRMQIFGGVVGLPWAMKPIIGLLSDCFPIRGYNKGPYIILSSITGVVALALLGAAPQSMLTIERVVGCLFLMSLQLSTCDLLTEAKYAEKMQEVPEHGPDLMTFVWFGLQAAGLAATVLVGEVMTQFGPKAPYLLAVIPAMMIIMPASKNYLEETVKTAEEVQACRRKLLEQKEACFLCVLMFVGTVVLTILGIYFQSVALNAAAALVVAFVMLAAFTLVLRPVIAKVNAFFLIQTSLGFSIGGASFYFFTDGPKAYPEGPHFSMVFYTSVLGVVGSVCSLIGIYSYQKCMKNWTYRELLMMTNIVLSILSLSDCVVFSRLNLKLGIPDKAFVLGASVLQTIVGQWMWMPGVVILSQLCPKGMEATMYALLAGCHNLGNTIASACGAYALQLLGCNPSGADNESHEFDRLWLGSALSTALPMLTLVLIPFFIPDAKQTDKILDDDDRDATTGSLWRRLTGT